MQENEDGFELAQLHDRAMAWLCREALRPASDENRCEAAGCDLPSLWPRVALSNAGDRLDRYCPVHSHLVAMYGRPERPDVLRGLRRCKYFKKRAKEYEDPHKLAMPGDESVEADNGALTAGFVGPTESALAPGSGNDAAFFAILSSEQCTEPAIGNGLCIEHAVRFSPTQEARECVFAWIGESQSLRDEPFTSDDAWRVLAEVDKVRRRGTSNSVLPPGPYSAERFMAGMFLGMMSAASGGEWSPALDERVNLAFWLSPFSLGATLDLRPEEVSFHLHHLEDAGYIVRDPLYELGRRLIITRENHLSRDEYWRWKLIAWKRARDPSKFPQVVNIPKPNEVVTTPVLEGAGSIYRNQQGIVMGLTSKGRVELRSWQRQLSEAASQKRRERRDLLLTVLLIVLTSLLLISAISDAPRAWHVLQAWFEGRPVPS